MRGVGVGGPKNLVEAEGVGVKQFANFGKITPPWWTLKKYHPLSFYFNVAVTKLQYGNYIVSLPGLFVNIDWIFADYKVLIQLAHDA